MLERVVIRMQRAATPAQANTTTLVSGAIVDLSGSGVSNASIVLTDVTTAADRTVRTDESGRFEFAGLPFGQYLIGVTAPGLEPFHDRLMAPPGGNVQVNVTMRIQGVSLSMTAGRPVPAGVPVSSRPLPPSWVCLDEGRIPGPFCGPPSLIEELTRDVKAQGEAASGQPVQAARLTTRAEAMALRYPQDMWDAMVEGTAVIEGRIGSDGTPVDLKSVAPVHPALAKAALDVVSQWRFEPARLRGQAVEAPLRIAINYRLHQQAR
jgi:TonB family protein